MSRRMRANAFSGLEKKAPKNVEANKDEIKKTETKQAGYIDGLDTKAPKLEEHTDGIKEVETNQEIVSKTKVTAKNISKSKRQPQMQKYVAEYSGEIIDGLKCLKRVVNTGLAKDEKQSVNALYRAAAMILIDASKRVDLAGCRSDREIADRVLNNLG